MKPSPQRILVVEDDAHIALGLREVLTGEGFEVIPCARGDLAVDLCLRQHPDLVLLDVMLPGLSGYDVCRQLRSRGCHTPILMLTAKGQELDKVVRLQIGAAAVRIAAMCRSGKVRGAAAAAAGSIVAPGSATTVSTGAVPSVTTVESTGTLSTGMVSTGMGVSSGRSRKLSSTAMIEYIPPSSAAWKL